MAWAYSHWIKGRVSEASLAHSSICRAQDLHQVVPSCAADEQGNMQAQKRNASPWVCAHTWGTGCRWRQSWSRLPHSAQVLKGPGPLCTLPWPSELQACTAISVSP